MNAARATTRRLRADGNYMKRESIMTACNRALTDLQSAGKVTHAVVPGGAGQSARWTRIGARTRARPRLCTRKCEHSRARGADGRPARCTHTAAALCSAAAAAHGCTAAAARACGGGRSGRRCARSRLGCYFVLQRAALQVSCQLRSSPRRPIAARERCT
jgi:hypothetical protein